MSDQTATESCSGGLPSKRARTDNSEGDAGCAASGSCPGVAQTAAPPLTKTTKVACREGLSSCRQMPAIRNEVAALKICCAPDIAKRRLCVVGDVLGSKKQLQGVYLHRSVEGFLADDPQSRDCHFPRRVVSFPAAWEQQVRKEPSMQRPSFEISKTGPPTEVKTGGGGKLGYCLPANAPLVAQQQAEGCSQHWHATPIGLMSESGPLYFEEDPQASRECHIHMMPNSFLAVIPYVIVRSMHIYTNIYMFQICVPQHSTLVCSIH